MDGKPEAKRGQGRAERAPLQGFEHRAAEPVQTIDYAGTLTAIGEAVYDWDMRGDILTWSDNAMSVLRAPSSDAIASGRHFARLVAADSPITRYEAIMAGDRKDEGAGVPYVAQYRFVASPSDPGVWLEDCGRWYADEDGIPLRACGTVRVITARRQEEERLTYLSRYDDLTGQLNRVELLGTLNKTFDETLDNRQSMVFAIARVDNLAVINQAYGFDVADRVIANVGNRLKSTLRADDAIGRISGNKFGIVLRDCDGEAFEVAARRLIETISDKIITTDFGHVSTSISIGGVLAPGDARSASEALTRAHEALDQARRQYRGAAHLFRTDDEKIETRRRNVRIADEIVAGLKADQLRFAYQPIVEAANGRLAYHEALLRLDRPLDDDASGGALVAIAENLGLIRLIDNRVRDLAFTELMTCPDARLSINVSADSINDKAWLNTTTGLLDKRPDIASRIVFEITETAVVRSLDDAKRFVAALRDHGAKVAIDDFGAGYTSFHALKDLGVDLVKIDGMFITALREKNAREKVFIRALVDIAKAFGLKTVAEWVRDRETVEELTELGVDYFQGEMFGLASDERPWAAPQTGSAPAAATATG